MQNLSIEKEELQDKSSSVKSRRRWLDYLILAAIVGLLFYNILMFRGRGGLEEGVEAPVFALELINGEAEVDLESLRGKVVVLDFFSRHCGACKAALPGFDSLSKKYSESEVVFFVIARENDRNTGIGRLKAYWQENGYEVKVLMGNSRIFDNYRIYSIPSVVVIDKAGKVYRSLGNASMRELDEVISAIR